MNGRHFASNCSKRQSAQQTHRLADMGIGDAGEPLSVAFMSLSDSILP